MSTDNPVVKDFIIPLEKYPNLNENQTIHDAVQVIRSFICGENDHLRYAALLVLNDQNQLVGSVTLRDILRGLDPRFREFPKVKKFEGKGSEFPDLTILWEESFFVECTQRSHVPIKDFMSPIHHVKGGDPILKALSIMLSTNDDILPVVDKDKVFGVIRLEEIFKEINDRCKI